MINNVLLVDGESMHAIPVSYCLSAAHRKVHAGSIRPSPDLRFSRFRAKFHWWGEASWQLEKVRSYAARERIAVITACSEAGIRFLSENRRELETVAGVAATPSVESLDNAIDKANFADFLSRTTLPHPETAVFRAGQAAPRKLPTFPALLKPALGSGGERISYFKDAGLFEQFVEKGGLGRRAWVLQTYIQGRDAGCSVLCRNGKILAHTIQISIEPDPSSFAAPGAIATIHDDQALALAEQLAAALEWTGVANIDMRRDRRDGRFYLLEMNPRYWTTMLGSYRAGVNFPELACRDALGQDIGYHGYRDIRFVRGCSRIGWRGARLSERTLLWRLSDPGPVIAEFLRSRGLTGSRS